VAKPTLTTPWKTLTQAGARVHRGRRFLLREIHAGRLRAARIGGRGEILTRDEWIDQWVEDQATPVLVNARRRA
jgi:hypothetical protein